MHCICFQIQNTEIEAFLGKNTCVLLGKLVHKSKLGMTWKIGLMKKISILLAKKIVQKIALAHSKSDCEGLGMG